MVVTPANFSGTSRFELLRRLGEGGFGVVYEAFDRERGTTVALKHLRRADGAHLYRFKREFRTLADLVHPNLVALDELLTDGPHWFFTMELVAGDHLIAYVRPPSASAATPSNPESTGWSAAASAVVTMPGSAMTTVAHTPPDPVAIDFPKLRRAFVELATAVVAMHRRGIIHRDLKPSNVLVTPAGRVVVLDFGLVDDRTDAADEGTVVGTPGYMAPEQAAGDRAVPASDWYALGVMLFEALTGRLPFAGSGSEIIATKKRQDAPRVDALAPGTPPDLAALCDGLLAREHARRPGGESVLAQLGVVSHGSDDAAREEFIGRAPELARLERAFDATAKGPVAAFVVAPSGMGKTAVVRRFLLDLRARRGDALILTGRCYERESVPYKAIDALVDGLSQHLRSLPAIDVARLLPRDAAILARVFPVLLRVDEVARAPKRTSSAEDAPEIRRRATVAFRDLLFALAARGAVVLAVDDLQWGDLDSVAMLADVLRPPDAPSVLLVGAYRSEEADAPVPRAFRAALEIHRDLGIDQIDLAPLSPVEARDLALLRLGTATDALRARADEIALESAGNAFFVQELAQHAVSVGGGVALDAVVHERVDAMPVGARRLLEAAALSAQPLPAEIAAVAAGIERAEDREMVRLLRVGRLIRSRTRADGTEIETYHDRIREAVVGRMAAGDVTAAHRRLAVAWEASGLSRPETLVTHYHAAGDSAKTRHFAAAAAARAEDALAFDRAVQFYELLIALEDDRATKRRWRIALGGALVNAGRGFEGAEAYLAARDGAAGDELLELGQLAAGQFIRSGHLDEAVSVLDDLLPRVGVSFPRSLQRALAGYLIERLRIRLHGLAIHERPESAIPPAVLRRIDLLESIGAPLCLVDLLRGNALFLRGVRLALEAGEPRRACVALSGLVSAIGIGGTRSEKRSRQVLGAAQRLAVRVGDPRATARTVLCDGMATKLRGDWVPALARLEEAIALFRECPGGRWEIETARTLIADIRYWTGDWARLFRELPDRRRDAEEHGDLFSATHVATRLAPLVPLADDRIDRARDESAAAMTRWKHREFHLQHRFALCTAIDIDLYAGDIDAASARLTASWGHLSKLFYVFQQAAIEMAFYRARIALARAARGDGVALRDALADAKRIEKERAPWGDALASLVRATVAFSRDREGGLRQLAEAEDTLRRRDMHLYAWAVRYRRGQAIGGSAGEAMIGEAVAWMGRQEIKNAARVVDLLAPASSMS